MKRPIVQCSCCKGLGKVELSTTLFDTLSVITRSWQSTKGIYGILSGTVWSGITALNNRLVELEKLNLIECQRRGKAKYWKLK